MCLAIPGCVQAIAGADPLMRTGEVAFGDIVKQVSLACVPEVEVGQYVLVHAGLAISVIDEAQARAVFDYLDAASAPVAADRVPNAGGSGNALS